MAKYASEMSAEEIEAKENRRYKMIEAHKNNTVDVRTKASERQALVAELYHAGKTADEIAEALQEERETVVRDLRYMREQWSKSRNEDIGAWQARELQYYLERRDEILQQWYEKQTSAMATLVIKWSERIALLTGIDAPKKIDYTERDVEKEIKAYAEQEGVSLEEARRLAVERAMEIVNARPGLNSKTDS